MASRKGSARLTPVPLRKVRRERYFLVMNTPLSNHDLVGFQILVGRPENERGVVKKGPDGIGEKGSDGSDPFL
jgi:hypothetical protein